jgi:hypothetical protein
MISADNMTLSDNMLSVDDMLSADKMMLSNNTLSDNMMLSNNMLSYFFKLRTLFLPLSLKMVYNFIYNTSVSFKSSECLYKPFCKFSQFRGPCRRRHPVPKSRIDIGLQFEGCIRPVQLVTEFLTLQ